MSVLSVPGVEADDLIASYTNACITEGYDVVIASNDNDFLQLVRKVEGSRAAESSSMWTKAPSRNVEVFKPFSRRMLRERDVRALLHGVHPELQPDIRALCGDKYRTKSPGLTGGINRRHAAQLLEKQNFDIRILLLT
jgi:DNA polymerase-1